MQHLFLMILGGVGGAVSTFLLHKYGLSVVVASCVIGLIGATIGHFTKSTHLPLVIFAGTFVGMTSTAVGTIPLIIVGGVFVGIIYQTSLKIFAGFGGRLGTIAFISTVLAYYLFVAMKKMGILKFKK
ncbi:MAG: hypothetical protein ACWA5P_07510 [bacterium]